VFSGFFDTTSGPKTDVESYKTIRESIAKDCENDVIESEEILFLTDNPEGNG